MVWFGFSLVFWQKEEQDFCFTCLERMMREETENSMVSAPFFPVNVWFGALIRRESWEQKLTRFFLENLRDSELRHREGGQSSLSTEGTSSAPRRGLLVGPNRTGGGIWKRFFAKMGLFKKNWGQTCTQYCI